MARSGNLGFTYVLARRVSVDFNPPLAFFLPIKWLNDVRMPHDRPSVGLRHGVAIKRPGNSPEVSQKELYRIIDGRILDIAL